MTHTILHQELISNTKKTLDFQLQLCNSDYEPVT